MRLVVALVALVIASAAVEHAEAQGGKPEKQQHERTTGTQPGARPTEAAESPRAANAGTSSTKDRQQIEREERVVAAAEGQTRYAGYQAVLSLLGVGVAAGGTIFVIRTFRQTRAAAEAASAAVLESRRSADAAEKAFEASVNNANRELQAYVGLDRAVILDRRERPTTFDMSTIYARAIHLTFKNYGQTPADSFSAYWKYELSAKQKTWHEFPDKWNGMLEGWLGPGAERTAVVPFEINMMQEEELAQGNMGIQVFYEINYRDVFGGTTMKRDFVTTHGTVYSDNRLRMSSGEV